MSYLSQAIQEDILAGCASFEEIARKHEVPLSWVLACQEMLEDDPDYLDSATHLETLE